MLRMLLLYFTSSHQFRDTNEHSWAITDVSGWRCSAVADSRSHRSVGGLGGKAKSAQRLSGAAVRGSRSRGSTFSLHLPVWHEEGCNKRSIEEGADGKTVVGR